jgi:hypothetical protein
LAVDLEDVGMAVAWAEGVSVAEAFMVEVSEEVTVAAVGIANSLSWNL